MIMNIGGNGLIGNYLRMVGYCWRFEIKNGTKRTCASNFKILYRPYEQKVDCI